MTEWWTYTLSDFLMFSPRTYWRLVDLYNREAWPAQLPALAAGGAALWLARFPRAGAGRVLAALLAVAWLWVGWAFHWQRYAAINWGAHYAAVAFALQALLLAGVGWLRPGPWAVRRSGWLVATAGVVFYPFAGLAAGHPWTQAEVFGIAPEPTALVTLALLLGSRGLPGAIRWMLAAIPALSLLLGAATLLAMAQ